MRPLTLIWVLIFIPVLVFSQSRYLSTSIALQKYGSKLSDRSFIAFPEIREHPLIWIDSIPEKQVQDVLSGKVYSLNANPGEYFVFQIGVWALHHGASDVRVEFSDFVSKGKKSVSSSRITCFNTGGHDYKGRPFTNVVNVSSGHVQTLWIGIDLKGIERNVYTGRIAILSDGKRQSISVALRVDGEVIPNHGYDQGKRLSRLNWLNEFKLGVDEEVTKGYAPVEVDGNVIRILGRSLRVGSDGLPDLIESFFSPSNQSLIKDGEPVVNKAFRFVVEKDNGEKIYLNPGKLTLNKISASRAEWSVLNSSAELDVECKGEMEYDGFVDYRLKVTAKIPLRIRDIRLEVPVVSDKATYMMGLGHEGGIRTADWRFHWDVSKNQDALWLGAVNGGIQLKFKAENYVLPPNDNYSARKLKLPTSWGNKNRGGVRVYDGEGGDVLVNAYSGSRVMTAGDQLHYNFEMLLTPFKVIDREIKFNDRFFQDLPHCPSFPNPGYNSTRADLKIELAKKSRANILNIHHDVDIAPFINYPCMDENIEDIKALVEKAHKEDLRVGLYYTTRFLTVHQPEFWAFNSLNNEIVLPGEGEKHLMSNKIKDRDPRAWYLKYMRGRKYYTGNTETMEEGKFAGVSDLSVSTGSGTRLDNFYIGFFDWMVRNLKVDGFYYDETNLNRYTIRRARKILDTYCANGRLDLHIPSYLHDGRGLTTSLNVYMDMLPYYDFAWIGELQNYDRLPDQWLVEFSGIPFGVPAQMLWSGGNPWRGMVYGLTKREGWKPLINSPVGMWKFWDEHSFSKKTMVGYWEKDCPVQCSDELVKTTAYTGGGEVVVAVGNWSDEDREVNLHIDWKQLGLDPSKVQISIPEIPDFQTSQKITSLNKLVLPGGKGYLIVLK